MDTFWIVFVSLEIFLPNVYFGQNIFCLLCTVLSLVSFVSALLNLPLQQPSVAFKCEVLQAFLFLKNDKYFL
jgi:hypothetical protein